MALAPVEVVGAGLAGSIAALMAAKQGYPVRVWGAAEHAPARAVALSQPSLDTLATLGVDTQLGGSIQTIHVSRQGHFGHARLNAVDHGFEQFGRVVENQRLLDAVDRVLKDFQVIRDPRQIDRIEAGRIHVGDEHFQGNVVLSAPAKDLIDQLGIATQKRALNDRLWVAIAKARTDGVAYERFTSSGPLAVLPLGPDRVSLVWQVSGDVDAARLNATLGGRVYIESIEVQGDVPAMALWAESLARPNTALVGSAAQLLHPVAGQGLNLIIRQLTALFQQGFDDLPTWQGQAIDDRRRWMSSTLFLAQSFQWDWCGAGVALSKVNTIPGLANRFVRRFMEGK